MKKILQNLFLLMLISVVGIAQAQTVVYECDFEETSDVSEWIMSDPESSNQWCIGSATSSTGAKSMYVSSDGGNAFNYYYGETCITAYHEFTLEVGYYSISYDIRSKGESTFDFGRAFLAPSADDLTDLPYNFSTNIPDGWIDLGEGCISGINDWVNKQVAFNVNEAGDYKLVFYWVNDYSYCSSPAAVDNISMKYYSCLSVTTVNELWASVDKIALSWMTNSEAISCQIEYGIHGFEPGTGTIISNITNNSYVIGNLNQSTSYDFYITTLCGEDNYSYPILYTAMTECGKVELPYHESFDALEHGMPHCWSGNNVTALDKYLIFEYNGVAYSPLIDFPEDGLSIHFKSTINEGGGDLAVGVTTNPYSDAYILIDTISLYTDIEDQYYQVDIENIRDIADSGRIVFVQINSNNDNYSNLGISDLLIKEMDSYRFPTDFVFSEIGEQSARISWSGGQENASYQICVRTGWYSDTIDVGNENTVLLTNLEHNYYYAPMMRMICGTDTMLWRSIGSFCTYTNQAYIDKIEVQNITPTSVLLTMKLVETFSNMDAIVEYYPLSSGTPRKTAMIPSGQYSVLLTDLDSNSIYNAEFTLGEISMIIYFTTEMPIDGVYSNTNFRNIQEAPINSRYKYSYSQTIYPASVIKNMDTIKGIAYKSSDNAQTRDIEVYMANTSQQNIVLGKINLDEMTLVYDGLFTFSGAGWDTIMLTTPIVNNGGNIVVSVRDVTGNGVDEVVGFESSISVRHINFYRSNTNVYTDSLSDLLEFNQYVPHVCFVGNVIPQENRAPVVIVDSVGAGCIYLSWIDNSTTNNSYNVKYRVCGDNNWILHGDNITEKTATISNLIPGASYEIVVGKNVNGHSYNQMIVAVPGCSVVPLPYVENFSINEINSCWKVGVFSPINQFPEVSDNVLLLYANNYIILPTFDDEISNLQITLKINATRENTTFTVGVCDEPNTVYDYTPIKTIDVFGGEPQEKIVYLNNYTGEGSYIFLHTLGQVAISEVKVESIPACPKVSDLVVDDMTVHSIDVSWNTNGFDRTYHATIVPKGADISSGTPISCNSNSASFTGLTTDTEYDIYVTSFNGNEDGEPAMITARTLIATPFTIPLSIDFSDATQNASWMNRSYNGVNQWMIGDHGGNDGAAMFVSVDGANPYYKIDTMDFSIAYALIDVEEDGLYKISYDWKCEGGMDLGRAFLIPYTDLDILWDFEFTINNMENLDIPNWYVLDNNQPLNNSSVWRTESVYEDIQQGLYYLVYEWMNFFELGCNPPLIVDNIKIESTSCKAPMYAEVNDITTHSATISWIPSEESDHNWRLEIEGVDTVMLTEPSYTIDNLDMGSIYTYSIYTVCGEESCSDSYKGVFETHCGEIETLPYCMNFDNQEKYSIPYCWYHAMGTAYINEHGNLDIETNLYNTKNTLISLPKLSDDIDITTLAMSFYYSTFDLVKLYIGVSECPDDLSTFTIVDTLIITNYDVGAHLTNFENYTGTGKYISFMMNDDGLDQYQEYQCLIDDVCLNVYSPCQEPISNLEVMYASNSITLSWEANPAQTAWQIVAVDLLGNSQYYESSTCQYTINNLREGMVYDIAVRPICGDGVYGMWSVTEYGETECPMVENISVTNITGYTADVSWNSNSCYNGFMVNCHSDNFDTIIYIGESFVHLTNLEPFTTYTIIISAECYGCNSVWSLSSIFETNDAPAGIDGVEGDYKISVYPNPTNSAATIKLSGIEGDVMISVIDMNGRMIKNERMNCGGDCEKRLDVNNLAQGTYFVRVLGEKINSVRKLIVR